MKALFVGGSGTISLSIVRRLMDLGWEVWTLNRGNRKDEVPEGVKEIFMDVNDEEGVRRALDGLYFDTVASFIVFDERDARRDIRLFGDKTDQYIFISSASAYQKPLHSPFITEETPLENPYWEYSRNKKAAEEVFFNEYRNTGFPITVVRPSHTYDDRKFPVAIHGKKGSWQVVKRMLEGKKILVPGDGLSFWTLTWCEDFALGFTGLMGRKETIGEAYQITGNDRLTWNEILSTIAEAVSGEYRPCFVPSSLLGKVGAKYGYDFTGELLGDKANNVIFVNTKLRALVPEMVTKTSFKEGAKRAAERILSDKSLQVEDPEFDEFSDRVVKAMERVEDEI